MGDGQLKKCIITMVTIGLLLFLLCSLSRGRKISSRPPSPGDGDYAESKAHLFEHGLHAREGEYLVMLRKSLALNATACQELLQYLHEEFDLPLPTLNSLFGKRQEIDDINGGIFPMHSGKREGFVLKLNNEKYKQKIPLILEAIQENSMVDFLEANSKFSAQQQVQNNPEWGLDRINQRDLPLDAQYTYTSSAQSVHIYVLDTGVLSSHNEFESRASSDYSSVAGSPIDCNGHGTHVASIAGGVTYGVIKNARIHGVKVLDCDGNGDTSTIVDGLNWVLLNYQTPAVVTMSLGGDPSPLVDAAVRNLIQAGISVVVAAGNENRDACLISPARVDEAITVAASTPNDNRASFSNYGSCVDIFAPGSQILGAWIQSNSDIKIRSGTSMATPFVGGTIAQFLQENPETSPSDIEASLMEIATTNRLADIGPRSPNILIFSPLNSVSTASRTCNAPFCTTYFGSLNEILSDSPRESEYIYEPNGQYYFVSSEDAQGGFHRGRLEPANSNQANNLDFELSLLRYESSRGRWQVVALSSSDGSYESIIYNGPSGYYIWRVWSIQGNGDYRLHLEQPRSPIGDYDSASSLIPFNLFF